MLINNWKFGFKFVPISGGIDRGHRPRISNLRLGSPAAQSDSLSVGDYILSVNGDSTSGLNHDSVVDLLRNSEDSIDLQIEYEMPQIRKSISFDECKISFIFSI